MRSNQRIAVIDLGTNTFNLIIAERQNGAISQLHKTKIPVKLGEGGLDKGIIAPEPFARGIAALQAHQQTIAEFGVDKVLAFATSGIRSTSNGHEFVALAKLEANTDIRVIDGDEEARYIHKGVQQALTIGSEPELIIDIGGGSTEFVLCNDSEIFWKQSFKLGVSRLKELFKPQDPIAQADIDRVEAHLRNELQPLFEACAKHPTKHLIGSSGSFDTFADMIALHHLGSIRAVDETTYDFDLSVVADFHRLLLRSTLAERIAIPGMLEFRADMIVLASVFIQFVIRELHIEHLRLSTYALKEGVMAEAFGQ